MVRTQIYLTAAERTAVARLARARRTRQSVIIREAVDAYLHSDAARERVETIERVAGLWKQRTDLPDFAGLRRAWDRGDAR